MINVVHERRGRENERASACENSVVILTFFHSVRNDRQDAKEREGGQERKNSTGEVDD